MTSGYESSFGGEILKSETQRGESVEHHVMAEEQLH